MIFFLVTSNKRITKHKLARNSKANNTQTKQDPKPIKACAIVNNLQKRDKFDQYSNLYIIAVVISLAIVYVYYMSTPNEITIIT